jgi:corrinoid protein of di/trimethylamine methyltransferase
MKRKEILAGLADAVVQMDEKRAVELAQAALDAGIEAYQAVTDGLSKGMAIVSDKYEREEYFVPEILMCADALYAALEVLKPHLKADRAAAPAKIVIGVVEGDIHDIGKNIVKLMLETAGFEVHDLGRDVPVRAFVDKAKEVGADIIALSTLMSITMRGMRRVIELLEQEGLRDRFKVIVGGGPLSPSLAEQMGADAYGESAAEAVRIAQRFVARRSAAESAASETRATIRSRP